MSELAPLPPPIHVIRLSTANPAACLQAAQTTLTRSSAALHSLTLKPVGDRFEAVLKLEGGDDRAASRMADMLAAWPEIGWVRLEHHLLRK
jgi:hypothetical protein